MPRDARGRSVSDGPREPPRFPLRLDRLAPNAQAPRGAERRPAPPGAAPAGLGLDSQHVRARMVERLVAEGVRDARVLDAMRAVPRHLFVDSALANQAYEDTSLPIGLGQTISKPSVVARMIELMLALRPAGTRPARLLEIGTGCGYQAAVLAQIGRSVVSIERLRPLHERAREHLAAALGIVHGRNQASARRELRCPGLGQIVATGGGDDAVVGRIRPVPEAPIPVHEAQVGQPQRGQVLMVVDRLEDGRLQRSRHEAVRFVPLKSGID